MTSSLGDLPHRPPHGIYYPPLYFIHYTMVDDVRYLLTYHYGIWYTHGNLSTLGGFMRSPPFELAPICLFLQCLHLSFQCHLKTLKQKGHPFYIIWYLI